MQTDVLQGCLDDGAKNRKKVIPLRLENPVHGFHIGKQRRQVVARGNARRVVESPHLGTDHDHPPSERSSKLTGAAQCARRAIRAEDYTARSGKDLRRPEIPRERLQRVERKYCSPTDCQGLQDLRREHPRRMADGHPGEVEFLQGGKRPRNVPDGIMRRCDQHDIGFGWDCRQRRGKIPASDEYCSRPRRRPGAGYHSGHPPSPLRQNPPQDRTDHPSADNGDTEWSRPALLLWHGLPHDTTALAYPTTLLSSPVTSPDVA